MNETFSFWLVFCLQATLSSGIAQDVTDVIGLQKKSLKDNWEKVMLGLLYSFEHFKHNLHER